MSGRGDGGWDYVVVGAGIAGCVLANRLSADPACRVLLLDTLPRSRPDGACWIEPEAELDGRRLCWPRACLLDGGNLLNPGCYVRGQPEDYDEWAARGNDGWDYATVLPYFTLSENSWRGPGPFHGVGGPVMVAPPRQQHPLSGVFVDAALERGLRANADFNGPRQEGVGLHERAQDDGRGGSAAASTFLRQAGTRRNLRVLAGVSVLRLLVEGGRAVGVECARGGRVLPLRAAREVLVSDGSVGSPRLLMLSGIGDALQLRALGIGVVANLPGVGASLQDALHVGLTWRRRDRGGEAGPIAAVAAALRGLFTRGWQSKPARAEAGGFVRSALAPDSRPDLQLHFVPREPGARERSASRGQAFSLHVSALRPRSGVALRLASADPAVPPRILPHYLREREDLDLLIEGVRLARELVGARAFDAWRADELAPGPGQDTRHALSEFIRRRADTLCTPVGGCRMGPAGEAGAVVDAALRVHGVQGLRVIDASVMPQPVSGSAIAPTMMIGERGAELVLRDWR